MKTAIKPRLIFYLLASSLPLSVPSLCGEALTPDEPSLRLSEPIGAVISDLETYIPRYMEQESIPGVGIALIRDAKVDWTAGFGVTNTMTRDPVTAETLFEVASNSKVMTAYIALRLVDQGKLALDAPLNDYLSEPWLPPSEYRNQITLRHVLSHSSGLGHNTLSRENLFAPGRGYSYSGIGYLYLQEVIEEVTGQDLEQVAQEFLFTPLGMKASSYVNENALLLAHTANGHLWAVVPAAFFIALYLAALLLISLIGLPPLRISTGRWSPNRRVGFGALIAAFPLAIAPPFIALGWVGLSEFAWAITFCGFALLTSLGLSIAVGVYATRQLFFTRHKTRIVARVLWILLTLAGLALIARDTRNLPIPRWTSVPPGAASSVRATAQDVATFLLELSDPEHLERETAQDLRTPQVQLSRNLSWGLGPGIQHTSNGDALWQWGQHIDFQSVMIIYPDLGFGVVVLTNNDLLNPEVAIQIAHRAIGGAIEPIVQGSHLEFDYRE